VPPRRTADPRSREEHGEPLALRELAELASEVPQTVRVRPEDGKLRQLVGREVAEPRAARDVAGDVDDDSPEPGLERPLRPEAASLAQSAGERLLDCVARGLGIAEDGIGAPDEGVESPLIERGDRRLVDG
jgi:hypothetical protein